MFEIRPNCLYTKQDLERELGGVMALETFLEGLPLARHFKKAWWGADLIRAINEVHEAERPRHPAPVLATRPSAGIRPARPRGTLEKIPMPTE
jgi:hypothetical protein